MLKKHELYKGPYIQIPVLDQEFFSPEIDVFEIQEIGRQLLVETDYDEQANLVNYLSRNPTNLSLKYIRQFFLSEFGETSTRLQTDASGNGIVNLDLAPEALVASIDFLGHRDASLMPHFLFLGFWDLNEYDVEKSPPVQVAAVNAIRQLGDLARPYLDKILEGKDEVAVLRASLALKIIDRHDS